MDKPDPQHKPDPHKKEEHKKDEPRELSSPAWEVESDSVEHGTVVGMKVAATESLAHAKVSFIVEVDEGHGWKPHSTESGTFKDGHFHAKVKVQHPAIKDAEGNSEKAHEPAKVRFHAESD